MVEKIFVLWNLAILWPNCMEEMQIGTYTGWSVESENKHPPPGLPIRKILQQNKGGWLTRQLFRLKCIENWESPTKRSGGGGWWTKGRLLSFIPFWGLLAIGRNCIVVGVPAQWKRDEQRASESDQSRTVWSSAPSARQQRNTGLEKIFLIELN